MLLTSLQGKPDLWPHMLVKNILQSWFEYSQDGAVIPFLSKYHQWLSKMPESTFSNGYWPRIRFGDNIETCYWLYNRTANGFFWIWPCAFTKTWAAWRDGIINWHNVNLAQGFREPGRFLHQSGHSATSRRPEANYLQLMGIYGQFPGGGFAGDENCRPGYTDPRQGFETCGIVEFMHSFEMLTKISVTRVGRIGNEEIAFNSFPAALTHGFERTALFDMRQPGAARQKQ
jgi:hypothetical protein